jgi:hypothetical protein
MRECPEWFQSELTRIGGTNHYGETIFKLVWSTEPRMTIGGRWESSGFVGYKEVPMIHGEPCWALMVWEPASVYGTYEQWERDYRDEETGLLVCGGYPKYGTYRLLQKFMHREIAQERKEEQKCSWVKRQGRMVPHVETVVLQKQELRTYRMEPCGLMLDLMLPMLMSWRRLSNEQKVAALKQQERERDRKYVKEAKDIRESMKMGRVMRGSKLVQKRAEVIEQGMRQAMAIAVKCGLGMRMETI